MTLYHPTNLANAKTEAASHLRSRVGAFFYLLESERLDKLTLSVENVEGVVMAMDAGEQPEECACVRACDSGVCTHGQLSLKWREGRKRICCHWRNKMMLLRRRLRGRRETLKVMIGLVCWPCSDGVCM